MEAEIPKIEHTPDQIADVKCELRILVQFLEMLELQTWRSMFR